MVRLAVVALAALALAAPAAAELVTPSFGYVRTARQLYAWEGKSWRKITPPHLPGGIYDVDFVDALHGWVLAIDCAGGGGALIRTTDGGRTWQALGHRTKGCSVQTGIDFIFLDAVHGWVVHTAGTDATIASTRDGGTTWRGTGRELPYVDRMRVSFRTPLDGWLVSLLFSPRRLYTTHDRGRSWRPVLLPGVPGWPNVRKDPDVPVFFGRRGALPVALFTRRRCGVAFYTSADGGKSWKLRAVREVGFRTRLRYRRVRFPAVGIGSPSTWWLGARLLRPEVEVTHDGGRTWQTRPLPRGAAGLISAAGDRSAWIESTSGLIATSDGERTWRPLRTPR